jgi:hypothetical protein
MGMEKNKIKLGVEWWRRIWIVIWDSLVCMKIVSGDILGLDMDARSITCRKRTRDSSLILGKIDTLAYSILVMQKNCVREATRMTSTIRSYKENVNTRYLEIAMSDYR